MNKKDVFGVMAFVLIMTLIVTIFFMTVKFNETNEKIEKFCMDKNMEFKYSNYIDRNCVEKLSKGLFLHHQVYVDDDGTVGFLRDGGKEK